MKKFIVLIGLTAVLFISGCQLPRTSGETPSEQGGTVVRIQPETTSLKMGDTISIDILIENVSDLMGVELELKFDPAVLQAQDTDTNEDGVQVQSGAFLSPDFKMRDTVDNNAGVAEYIAVQLAPREPVSGSGLIASITFKAIAPGESELTLTKTTLASPEGERISATAISSRVTVGK